MTENRFQLDSEQNPPIAPTGFLVMPLSNSPAAQPSPLEWLYQQMYAQAAQANQATQRSTQRELFGVMN
jgi:hypothetical protein